MAKENMTNAKKNKNDEFYTQYSDIQKEINAYIEYNPDIFKDKVILLPCDDPEWSNFTKFFVHNFEKFGIKKLISTSFAPESKRVKKGQLTLFETMLPQYDETKTNMKGKIFTLFKDKNNDKIIDIDDLEWEYLESDGDFRSDEVTKLRDEADIIITNPPFSLFKEFLTWILEANKKFLIIGNINVISYKETFRNIKENKIWLGNGMGRWISGFIVPDSYELYGTEARIDNEGNRIVATNNCLWITNLDHGRRHQFLKLMTLKDNLKYNKKLKKKLEEYKSISYLEYNNYNAIDIPFTEAIPSDYEGVMGVPITFLDKYNPDQFEIIGLGNGREHFTPNKDFINPLQFSKDGKLKNGNMLNRVLAFSVKEKPDSTYYKSDNSEGYLIAPYARILIKKKNF